MLINFFGQKLLLSLVTLFTLVASQSPISQDLGSTFKSDALVMKFSEFSPAFAAFQDDFLFPDEGQKASPLIAGIDPFQVILVEPPLAKEEPKTEPLPPSRGSEFSVARLLDQFDGDFTTSKATNYLNASKAIKAIDFFKKEKTVEKENNELGFGSLFAMAKNNSEVPQPTQKPKANKKPVKTSDKKPNNPEMDTNSTDKDPENTEPKDRYIVSGGIRLNDGLAFIGSMDVTWVVGDYELKVGSINVPDATYEIEVSKLIGDVIISLYDSRNELIGEGILNLSELPLGKERHTQNIMLYPIDWDVAGEIVDAYSLGMENETRLKDVEVALYSFNDATRTDTNGVFSFYNWKKANSRTLAIASKNGYRDSIFTLDSKTEANVILFSESYMNAYFSFLQDLGIYGVKDQGTVYGQVTGVENVEGYRLKLEKARPIYFMTAGFANVDQDQTSSNGLFSFVGLQDGDYELIVEKDGEILDTRIVVVEQGKVSPIFVDLSKVTKHIEFFDPLMPERKIPSVEISFFDGSSTQSLDKDNQLKQMLHRGQDVSLMEYSSNNEVNRTLLSRHKGLQKVPLLNDKKLLDLANKQGYEVEDGLVFGFVDSEETFAVYIAESEAANTVYFDESGNMVKPGSTEAIGFILAGFPQGLSSIVVQSYDDDTILGTDLVFSDHNSISVTHLEILPME